LVTHNYINLDKINKYTGTSFGAIFCFLLSIGYNTEELLIYFKNFKKKDMDIDLNLELFLSKYGFNDGNSYMDIVDTLFKLKTKLRDINFIDLEIFTKKKIYIIGTNFSRGKKEVFSSETSPNMSVILAIRISISIPFLFTPIIYNNNYYVDGCLTSDFGVEYCNIKTTLCLCLKTPKCFNYDSIYNIISGIMTIAIKKEIKDLKKLEIIQNDCSSEINADDIYFKKILDIGTTSALIFLKKEYKLEIKNLLSNLDIKKTIFFANLNKYTDDRNIIKEYLDDLINIISYKN
jgi:predicted patatin/cPLA2 family phospholipase